MTLQSKTKLCQPARLYEITISPVISLMVFDRNFYYSSNKKGGHLIRTLRGCISAAALVANSMVLLQAGGDGKANESMYYLAHRFKFNVKWQKVAFVFDEAQWTLAELNPLWRWRCDGSDEFIARSRTIMSQSWQNGKIGKFEPGVAFDASDKGFPKDIIKRKNHIISLV